MRIALCLAGQYRTFDADPVQKTLHKFILDRYDCDIYVSLWNNRGVSHFHGSPVPYKNVNERITKDHVLRYVNPHKIEIEDYDKWKDSVSASTEALIKKGDICFNTPPQLYMKDRVVKLIDKDLAYDLVIVTRPDMFYVDGLNFESFIDRNTVWNINPPGWQHYPKRVYDIFYMGVREVVEKMAECYYHFDTMTDDPHGSGLRMLDCCKILYIHALRNGIKVDTTPTVIGDIYRNDESIEVVCRECKKDRKEIGI